MAARESDSSHPVAPPESSTFLLPERGLQTHSSTIGATWVLSDMQNPRPRPGPTGSESAFSQIPERCLCV